MCGVGETAGGTRLWGNPPPTRDIMGLLRGGEPAYGGTRPQRGILQGLFRGSLDISNTIMIT